MEGKGLSANGLEVLFLEAMKGSKIDCGNSCIALDYTKSH